jgi:hypothetical protein
MGVNIESYRVLEVTLVIDLGKMPKNDRLYFLVNKFIGFLNNKKKRKKKKEKKTKFKMVYKRSP